jgi:hypothetical protein
VPAIAAMPPTADAPACSAKSSPTLLALFITVDVSESVSTFFVTSLYIFTTLLFPLLLLLFVLLTGCISFEYC